MQSSLCGGNESRLVDWLQKPYYMQEMNLPNQLSQLDLHSYVHSLYFSLETTTKCFEAALAPQNIFNGAWIIINIYMTVTVICVTFVDQIWYVLKLSMKFCKIHRVQVLPCRGESGKFCTGSQNMCVPMFVSRTLSIPHPCFGHLVHVQIIYRNTRATWFHRVKVERAERIFVCGIISYVFIYG